MLDHPVGGRLAQSFRIFVYNGLLVVVGFCVVHEALAVALDLCESRVSAAVEFSLAIAS